MSRGQTQPDDIVLNVKPGQAKLNFSAIILNHTAAQIYTPSPSTMKILLAMNSIASVPKEIFSQDAVFATLSWEATNGDIIRPESKETPIPSGYDRILDVVDVKRGSNTFNIIKALTEPTGKGGFGAQLEFRAR